MGYRVLIVDDSATMRKVIMRGLRQTGLDIDAFVEAADGAEGLAALDAERVDLVLSDVNMPDTSGLDLLDAIKGREDRPPVVMITTEGSDEVVARAMESGANGYIRKPFSPEMIQQVIGPFLK